MLRRWGLVCAASSIILINGPKDIENASVGRLILVYIMF